MRHPLAQPGPQAPWGDGEDKRWLTVLSPGPGPSRGGTGGYGGGDSGQPALGEREGLCADGGGQWPAPRTAQH